MENTKYIEGTDGEIAQQMIDGKIDGPVITNNCFLINVRITGTGETPRTLKGVERIFVRQPGVFLSTKFLDMCNGLPVVFYRAPENDPTKHDGHPADGELDYDNWKDCVCGSIMMAYIKDQEVWGIAKVFDLPLLDEIMKGTVQSTSPFVTSLNVELPEGKVEEKLEDLNHVAFCAAGHWDQNAKGPAIIIGDILFKKAPGNEDLEKKDKKGVDKNNLGGVEFNTDKGIRNFTGGNNMENELEIMKADSAAKAETITALKDELSKKDEAIKAKDEEAKKKDEEASKLKDMCDKKDAEIAALKEKGDDDDDDDDDDDKKDAHVLAPIKGKIDSMMTRLGDAADPALKELQAEVNALIGHEEKEGELHEELIGDDDDEKEEIVNAVSELADSAHADIAVNRPVIKAESKFDYIRRVLNANKGLVAAKYHGLMAKVDASNFALAKDALVDMQATVTAKSRELMGKAAKGAKVAVRTEDGAITDVNYGRN